MHEKYIELPNIQAYTVDVRNHSSMSGFLDANQTIQYSFNVLPENKLQLVIGDITVNVQTNSLTFNSAKLDDPEDYIENEANKVISRGFVNGKPIVVKAVILGGNLVISYITSRNEDNAASTDLQPELKVA